VPEVLLNGRAAVEVWEKLPIVYGFQWTALVPLVAAAIRSEDALAYARTLLAPTQQRLPSEIGDALADGVRLWDEGNRERAKTVIAGALDLARARGFL
jgi:hypothetical protein